MRSRGRIGCGSGPAAADQPIDVWLPRYRSVPVPEDLVVARRVLAVVGGGSAGEDVDVTIVDVAADGYRLRLVEFAAAYDRVGFYGDAAGDFPDNAWRFTLLCRSALETIRVEGGGVDLLHLHDWHTGPALLLRDGPLAAVPEVDGIGGAADDPQPRVPRLGARRIGSTSWGSARRTMSASICCAKASFGRSS